MWFLKLKVKKVGSGFVHSCNVTVVLYFKIFRQLYIVLYFKIFRQLYIVVYFKIFTQLYIVVYFKKINE